MYPVLFQISDFPVRSWGIMVMLGLIAGLWLTIRLARGTKYTTDTFLDFAIYAFLVGIVGARLWEVVFSWEQFSGKPLQALMLWEGGLSIQGAVAANVIYLWWYTRREKLSFWKFADFAAPGLILGQAIGRIGCLLNGDAYGRPTDAWFGVVYQPGTAAFSAWGATPLIPAELFEGFADLGILGVLLHLSGRKQFDGQVTLAYFILYSLARFGLEFLRTDSLMIGGMKAAQLTALTIAIVAGIMLLSRAKASKGLTIPH